MLADSPNPLDDSFLRFLPEVYQAAQVKELDALPLLHSLEYAREVATGAQAILRVIRNNENLKVSHLTAYPLNDTTTDQMLALCIASLNLLNEQIESLADHYATTLKASREREV